MLAMPWYNPFKSRKNKDGEEKVDDKAALADAGNGRYLVRSSQGVQWQHQREDISEIVEIDMTGRTTPTTTPTMTTTTTTPMTTTRTISSTKSSSSSRRGAG